MNDAGMMERAVIGAMLLDSRAIEASGNLEISDLQLDSHRTILTTIRRMHEQGTNADTVTVMNEMMRTNLLSSIGGAGYLADITSGIPRNFDVRPGVKAIREKSALRSILSLCEYTKARVESGEESSDILHDLQGRALEQQAAAVYVRPTPIAELVMATWEGMKHQREFSGEVLGIPTGIADLDRSTTGWRDGELTYVGALPGRGKTSFLLQAMYAAAVDGFGVGCISLEMRGVQLLRRLSIISSRLHAHKFRDVRLMNASEFDHAKKSLFGLAEIPISICDQSGLKPAQISSLARQMHAQGAKVIFIDFVQIIHEDGRERREAINRVSAALRDTCKHLNIPFVVASQLARRDSDPNRRPTIQDLRESGNLEQDAHNVLLLYRPKDKSNGDWTGEDEIIIDKQREGVTGTVPVRYDERSLTYVAREESQ